MMKCNRPMCDEEESRINGYCSVYCEDVDEARQQITHLKAALILITDIAYDYDGNRTVESLMKLVDELAQVAIDALKDGE